MQYSHSTHELDEQYGLFWILLEKLPMALLLVFLSLTFVYWAVEIYSLVNEWFVEAKFQRRMAEKTKRTTDNQPIYRFDQIYNDQSYVRRPQSRQFSGTNYFRDLFNHSSSNFREESSKRDDDCCINISLSCEDKVKDVTIDPYFV
ncbi:Uncharacterized protein FWK35_00038414 [Aphis craccivora]|uniref:Uncharacterized protein n=1 Tax=Aphis craccivora TaxID=307492 RepID=A0A6G0Z946_APHCR|nr:Uncharacterized protein FWK35_00038414 [Aphis craccivora]